MFAVVRTGGKQYRVAAGDKIVVDKLIGEAGETIALTDVLFTGGEDASQTVKGLTVSAEIIAQAKADKIVIFKKKRRHNYRRKAGHRQQHTILRIVSVGDAAKKAAPKKAEAEPVAAVDASPAAAPASDKVTAAAPTVKKAAAKKASPAKKPAKSSQES